MIRKYNVRWIVCLFLCLAMVGCTNDEIVQDNDEEQRHKVQDKEDALDIDITSYGEEIGFKLESPTKQTNHTETSLDLKGSIEKTDELNEHFIWVIIEKNDKIDVINDDQFEYYIPIKENKFSEQINLHHGKGDYQITVRLPSNDENEEDIYYDGAMFSVTNQSSDIERDIQYGKYGVEQDLTLSKPVKGWNEMKETVLVEGTVSEEYKGDLMLIEIEKDGESKEMLIPVKDNTFSREIPLYFGEGHHLIRLRLLADDGDDLFYESASFYVNNQSSKEFADMKQSSNFFDSGINLETPGWDVAATQNEKEYSISGTIDQDAPGADTVSHLIVKVTQMEEEAESTYVIPVVDYKFEGTAYFRFGPGDYQVTINVPAEEQKDPSVYTFSSVLDIYHEVTTVEDERGLLPSRGIESDHPAIIKKAEHITSGIENDREKAKAIYEFVSRHVAYDVEKAENDIFDIDDSAVATLELGTGICQDYTFLTTALLRAVDIKSHYVEGYAGERHAWVEANLDGEWIEMDPTWGAGYVQDGQFHFQYNEDYFDPEEEFLAETHTREGIMY